MPATCGVDAARLGGAGGGRGLPTLWNIAPDNVLESPGFVENFGSCGEAKGLHLVGVLTLGDEFREDVGLARMLHSE